MIPTREQRPQPTGLEPTVRAGRRGIDAARVEHHADAVARPIEVR